MTRCILAVFHLTTFFVASSVVTASPIINEPALQGRALSPYLDQLDGAAFTDPPPWRGPDFSGALPAMLPTYSWKHDLEDLSNLIPVYNKVLYYTDSGSRDVNVDHQYATMDTTFAYPVIVQSHSALIKSVACLGDSRVKVSFRSTEAADYAQEQWSKYSDANPFVLVAHSEGCNTGEQGQNAFFKIKSMKLRKRSLGGAGGADFEFSVEELKLEESVGEVDLTWGHHEVRNCKNGGCEDGSYDDDDKKDAALKKHEDDRKHDDSKGKDDNAKGKPEDHKGKPDEHTKGKPKDQKGSHDEKKGDNGKHDDKKDGDGKHGGKKGDGKHDDKKEDCKDGKDDHGKDDDPDDSNGDYGCGNPPSAELLGFPTGPCGPLFDVTIDDRLGYYDFTGNFSAALSQFAPGLPSYDINVFDPDAFLYDDLADPELVRRALRKRFGFLKKAFKAVVKVVKKVVAPVVEAVKDVFVDKVGRGVVGAVKAVVGAINRLTTIQGALSRIFDTGRIGPGADSNLPWGRQYQILEIADRDSTDELDYALSVWCVDCGIRSRNKVLGRVRFNLLTLQIQEASVALRGSFNATLSIGMDGAVSFSTSRKVNVISIQVGTPFFIPGIFIFGGQVSLDVEAYVSLSAAGQLLLGGSLVIPNYQGRLDLINRGSSGVSGFSPRFIPILEARGNVSAEMGLGLPIELGFGLTIPPIPSFNGLIGLRNTPWVIAKAAGKFSTNQNSSAVSAACRNGVEYRVDFINKVEADFFGSRSLLNQFVRPITSGCYRPGNLNKRQVIDLPSGGTSSPGDDNGQEPDSSASPAALADLRDDIALVREVNVKLARINRQQNEEATAQDVNTPDADGFTYIAIRDSQSRYALVGDDRGSLRLANNAAPDQGGQKVWANFEDTVALDSAERVLHYYPAQMAAFGISRFRLLDSDTLPQGSSIIELSRFQAPNGQSAYMAINTRADSFYLIACEYKGQAAKFFLSRDLDGRKKLMDPALKYIVTGGCVTSCNFIQLV